MNFKKKKLISDPFPMLIVENCLRDSSQKKIIREIEKAEKEKEVKKVMGGRYQYNKNFLEKDGYCNKIYDFFNKKSTFEFLFNQIYKSSNNFLINKNEYNSYLKNRGKKDNFFKKIFPQIYKNKFYLDMDFSIAKKNYFRTPHFDRNSRILSFLIYLNTTNKNNGGSLEIYKYKKNKDPNFDRFPLKKNLRLIKKIKPKFGTFISFLSSPDSIHGVEKFKGKFNEKRIFLYGSYTSFQDVIWKVNY